MLSLLVGIAAALTAAGLYSAGVTLQAIEARESPCEHSLKPSLLRDLFARKRWIAGTACVAGGWTMQGIALLLAPITVVQPALAFSVVGLLLIGMRFFDASVGRHELLGAVGIVVGVVGLALVSPTQSESHADGTILVVGMTVLGLIALVPYALHARRPSSGMAVVLSAGVAYAWTGFSTKFLADGVSSGAWAVGLLWLGATVLAAVIGLLSEMTALQTRSAIRVFPVVLVVQIVVAVLLAPLLAGEQWTTSPVFVLVLTGSLFALGAGTRTLCSHRGAVSQVVATE